MLQESHRLPVPLLSHARLELDRRQWPQMSFTYVAYIRMIKVRWVSKIPGYPSGCTREECFPLPSPWLQIVPFPVLDYILFTSECQFFISYTVFFNFFAVFHSLYTRLPSFLLLLQWFPALYLSKRIDMSSLSVQNISFSTFLSWLLTKSLIWIIFLNWLSFCPWHS